MLYVWNVEFPVLEPTSVLLLISSTHLPRWLSTYCTAKLQPPRNYNHYFPIMHFIHQLTITSTLLAALSYATPLTKRNRFTVHQTLSKSSRRHGPAALAHVYRKFGKSIPIHLANAATNINTNDSVAATPSPGDQEYDAVVTIGGQNFNLDFDTGSSDLSVLFFHP